MPRVLYLLFILFSTSLFATTTPTKPTFPFTGKVCANKVRMRAKPSLDSPTVRQMHKEELLLVTGEDGDFWVIKAPKDTKAYLFRSYVIDHVIEANRVNVRLEPHTEATIIGQLSAGTVVDDKICSLNNKWLEIPAPPQTKFYIAKELIVSVGGPEHLAAIEQRRLQAEELLSTAIFLAETENAKSYEETSLYSAIERLQLVLRTYAEFPDILQRAKETLALLQNNYLQKKLAYLEARAELSDDLRKELLNQHATDAQILLETKPKKLTAEHPPIWGPIEESLYLSWAAFHVGKKQEEFYQEQTVNAVRIQGTLEHYTSDMKNRPGDYVLRNEHAPVGYIYSTRINLDAFVGKPVVIKASPRPNYHFAFPAYFVLSIEEDSSHLQELSDRTEASKETKGTISF